VTRPNVCRRCPRASWWSRRKRWTSQQAGSPSSPERRCTQPASRPCRRTRAWRRAVPTRRRCTSPGRSTAACWPTCCHRRRRRRCCSCGRSRPSGSHRRDWRRSRCTDRLAVARMQTPTGCTPLVCVPQVPPCRRTTAGRCPVPQAERLPARSRARLLVGDLVSQTIPQRHSPWVAVVAGQATGSGRLLVHAETASAWRSGRSLHVVPTCNAGPQAGHVRAWTGSRSSSGTR
jgi:hypothetical protein